MTHGKQQRFEGSRFATCKSAEDVIGLDNQLIIRRAVDRVFPHQSLSIVDAVKRLTQSSRSATPAASATLAERVGAAVQRLVRRSPAGKQAELRRLLTQPAAMEAILSYLDDETISPAWMTCGVGCCTAEF